MADDEQQRQPVQKDNQLFRFTDPREEKLYITIKRLVGDGPAEFFKDACNLMADGKGLSTVSHLIAHLLRELECSIYDVLMPLAEKVEVPADQKQSNARAILHALEIPESDDAAKAWLELTKEDHRFQGKVHRRSLGLPRRLDDALREDWHLLLRALDVLLDRFEKRSSVVFEQLDGLLSQKKPDTAVLKKRTPNNLVAFDYFFGRLQDPQWLKPLYDDGFFSELPVDRICPQTKYLARMATHAEHHQTVLDIVMSVESENITVRYDLANAALLLPPEMTAKTVPKFVGYLETSPNLFILPYAVGKLVPYLAPGHPAEALSLASALLVISPEKDKTDVWHEPKTRIQSNDYAHILKEAIPPLAESGGFPVIEFLCGLLATAIEERRGNGEEHDYDDLSHYWRHAIDGHSGMHMSREVTNGLVTAVFSAAQNLLSKDASMLKQIVDMLDSKQWTIFQRVALQLLSEALSPAQEMVAQKLLDQTLWEGDTTRREYNLLAEAQASLLTSEQRQEIVARIEAGPDLTHLTDLEPERREEIARYWRRDRLAPFRDVLPPEWQRICDDLIDELGEPVDEPKVSSVRSVGSISPIDQDDLQAKSIEETVTYLRKWTPTGEWDEPDPDGLGDVLRNAVTEDPMRFAEKAELFAAVDPTYVRNIIGGFGAAVKAERTFPWTPVLRLCAWVLQQPVAIPGRVTRRFHDFDADWKGTRGGIVDLLSKGLMEGPASIPFIHRREVWELIQMLTDDSDPTPEHEAEYGGKNMNPYELAINTIRGDAMEAVIFYISWTLRGLNVTAGEEGRISSGLTHVPEAAAVLESHLDPQKDPALSIRALYGKWLPSLDYTDHEWTERMLPRILPVDATQKQLREAAWNTYLLYSGGPYNKTGAMLIPEYRLAVDNMGSAEPIARGDPQEALAAHIAILYLRGILKRDGEDGVIAAFLQNADAGRRGEFVQVMGDIVRHNKKPSREWIERAVSFWEERLEAAKAAQDPSQHAKEMDAFGYWFISGKFDSDWAITNLEAALQFATDIEFDYHVVDNLVPMARTRPLECARCLLRIMTSEGKGEWDIRVLVKNAREVLAVVFAGNNEPAKTVAREVIGVLRARGHHEIIEPEITLNPAAPQNDEQ